MGLVFAVGPTEAKIIDFLHFACCQEYEDQRVNTSVKQWIVVRIWVPLQRQLSPRHQIFVR